MRLLFILITLTLLTEAKKRRSKKKMKVEADDFPHEADAYPEQFIPVPFGHIFKEGFQPSLKLPVDLLELDRRYSKKIVREEFDNTDKSLRRNEKESKRMDSPKALFNFDDKVKPFEDKIDVGDVKDIEKKDLNTNVRKTWHDLAVNHARNLGETRKGRISHGTSGRISKGINYNYTFDPYPDNKLKEQFFSKSSFNVEIARREDKRYNWTTCDEFGRNADFHPNDVINIDWIPFYSWSPDEIQKTVSFVHRFSTPTIKLVQTYKGELGMYLNKTLDWSSPKLHLKSNMEMLLIAVDRRGQFDGIPYNDVPSSMKQNTLLTLPLVNLRLKILDPYLAMMFCEYQYATIMAVSGNEPTTIQTRTAAATLKFQGKGYPVARDLEAERMAIKLERDNKIRGERDKFIEERADYGLPIEI